MSDVPEDTAKRRSLKTLASGAITTAAICQASYVFAKQLTNLRVLGTHVTLQEELRQQAMNDLGIELEFEAKGSAALLHKASVNPRSLDLYEQWSNSIRPLWNSGSLQAIEKKRLTYWDKINPLTKAGKVTPSAMYGAGDAPYKILHIQPDSSLGIPHSELLSFLPYVHNVDSFGYNTDVIPQGIPYQTESWGWLLDRKYSGKVGVINAPSIGLFDLALAA